MHYFLPPAGGTSIATYTVGTKAWGSIAIPPTSPVAKMLSGGSLAGVAAAVPGIDDFLVSRVGLH